MRPPNRKVGRKDATCQGARFDSRLGLARHRRLPSLAVEHWPTRGSRRSFFCALRVLDHLDSLDSCHESPLPRVILCPPRAADLANILPLANDSRPVEPVHVRARMPRWTALLRDVHPEHHLLLVGFDAGLHSGLPTHLERGYRRAVLRVLARPSLGRRAARNHVGHDVFDRRGCHNTHSSVQVLDSDHPLRWPGSGSSPGTLERPGSTGRIPAGAPFSDAGAGKCWVLGWSRRRPPTRAAHLAGWLTHTRPELPSSQSESRILRFRGVDHPVQWPPPDWHLASPLARLPWEDQLWPVSLSLHRVHVVG